MQKKITFLLSLLTLLFAAAAIAQTTASIKGTIIDTSGAAVVGAKVIVTNPAVGIERTTTTNTSGDYEVPALPPGIYNVKVEASSFQTQQAERVPLEVSKNTVQNFNLKVAAATAVITVEGTAPVIETTTMTVGQSIDKNTVQEIPLNGRHFVDLGLLIPGSVTPPQNGFLTAPLRGQGSFAVNTAGNREDAVNFMINGINLNDMVQNQITFQPTINTVAEFKVDNSTYSAEYGRNSGAIVNIATRSGIDQFHGEAYEFLRNDWLDARNAFNTVSTGPISPFKRNQFGGDFGGPIVKDRTFFFLSYEGLRQRQGLTLATPVLSAAQRTSVQTSGGPVAKALTALIPPANGTLNAQAAFFGSTTAPVNIDQGTADINHKFSEEDQLHGYYVYQHDLRQETGSVGGASIPNFGDTREGKRQVLTLNETHVFSSNLVNEARLGANRILITFTPNTTVSASSVGLSTALGPNQQTMPFIVMNFLNQMTFGTERNFPQGRGDTTFVLANTVSWIHGRHSFKFGAEGRDFRNDNFNNDPGQLVYNSFSSFQTDTPSTAARTIGNVASRINQGALDFFGMDSFKPYSNLTFELGLRYAWNMTPSEAKNRFVTFDPTTVSLISASEPYAQNNKNFQPRVGFAWDLFHNGNTVLRGAYAYQVDQPITGVITGLAANPPFALPIAVNVATSITALTTSFNGIPSTVSPALVNPNFKNANMQSWNLNIQQQVGRDLGLMVGYFGSKGTHLEIDRNINQLIVFGVANTPAFHNVPFFQLSASSPFLPNVRLSNMTERDSSSNSQYNALWLTANKRMSHGLQFNASYTYSHSIDEVSRNNNGIIVPDSVHIGSGRGSSDFDARHRFVVNAIYDLPFKGNRFFVSGWELASIVSLQSGNPFDIVVSSASITGVGNTVTPIVSSPIVVTGNPFGQWVSPSSFTIPTTTLGNLGRNTVVGPDFKNLDLTLAKNTKLTERVNFQIRCDAFDLFNHPNFGQPSRILPSNTFATIGSTRFPTGDSGSSRQLQLAAKLIF